jgi:hypothetical protein
MIMVTTNINFFNEIRGKLLTIIKMQSNQYHKTPFFFWLIVRVAHEHFAMPFQTDYRRQSFGQFQLHDRYAAIS